MQLPLPVLGRDVGHSEIEAGLELGAGRLVALPPLLVDERRHRVGELAARRVALYGRPDRIHVKEPVVPERKQRTVDVLRQYVHFGGSRREEVRTAKAPAGQERAVLVDEYALVHEDAPVEEIGQATRLSWMLSEQHGYLRSTAGATRAGGASAAERAG